MDVAKMKPIGEKELDQGCLLCRRWNGERKFKDDKKQSREVGKGIIQCTSDVIIATDEFPTQSRKFK